MWSLVKGVAYTAAAVVGSYSVVAIATAIARRIRERRISSSISNINGEEMDMWTNAIRSIEISIPRGVPGQPHQHAAGRRTGANNAICDMIRGRGMIPWSYQMSRHDQRRKRDGVRKHCWVSDLKIPPQTDVCTKYHIPYMVDVDYYKNMPKLLARLGRPMFLATFVPDSAAKNTDFNMSYTFRPDGQIRVDYGAAASYEHHLWSWEGDTIIATHYNWWMKAKTAERYDIPFWSRFLCYHSCAYRVERRQVTDDYQIVGLIPIAKSRSRLFTPDPMSDSWWTYIFGRRGNLLRRFDPIHNVPYKVGNETRIASFARFRYLEARRGKGEPQPRNYMTTALCNEYQATNISLEADSALKSTALCSSKNPNPVTLSTVLPGHDQDRPYTLVPLRAYLSLAWQNSKDFNRETDKLSRGSMDVAIWSGGFDGDARLLQVPYMKPMIRYAMGVRADTAGNRQEAVTTRNLNTYKAKKPSRYLLMRATQFAVELRKRLGEDGYITPQSAEEVIDHRSRANQQGVNDQASYGWRVGTNQVMIKAESYLVDAANIVAGSVEALIKCFKPGRIIVQPSPSLVIEYARYMRPLGDYLKVFPWYGFKSPVQVAGQIADMCRDAQNVTCADHSRMDGRITEAVRECERIWISYLFSPQDAPHVIELHDMQINSRCRLDEVFYYNQQQRLSGSAETSVMNTLLSKFCAFLMFVDRKGLGISPEVAFNMPGVYAGDDSVTADLPPCPEVVEDLTGQILTPEAVNRGEWGVHFLNRYYATSIWFGDHEQAVSCIDVHRALTKIHLTNRKDRGPIENFVARMYPLILSDPHTPIIRKFARLRKAFEEWINEHPLPEEWYHFHAAQRMENQYPNCRCDHFDAFVYQKFCDVDPSIWERKIKQIALEYEGGHITYDVALKRLTEMPTCGERTPPVSEPSTVVLPNTEILSARPLEPEARENHPVDIMEGEEELVVSLPNVDESTRRASPDTAPQRPTPKPPKPRERTRKRPNRARKKQMATTPVSPPPAAKSKAPVSPKRGDPVHSGDGKHRTRKRGSRGSRRR